MWTIFRKEIIELLRDRRTLILMILIPAIIMPTMIGGFAAFAKAKADQESRRILKYAIFNADSATEFDHRLLALPRTQRLRLADAKHIAAAIKSGEIDFAITIPNDFEADLANGKSTTLTLSYNDADTVNTIGRRVRNLVDSYTADLRQHYLAEHGLNERAQAFIKQPVALQIASTANERERIGELAGALLPYMLLVFSLQACLASAADLGAGEKERGTLESLLQLPLSRSQIVLGKYCAITAIGCLTSMITILSLTLWTLGLLRGAGVNGIDQILAGLGLGDVALIVLLILPANAMVASLLLAISLYARSYREATTYGAQLMVLLFIPILLAMLPNMHLTGGWAWLPITNIALAMKEILKGTLAINDLLVVLLSTLLVASVLLKFCTEWCKRESVLFRS